MLLKHYSLIHTIMRRGNILNFTMLFLHSWSYILHFIFCVRDLTAVLVANDRIKSESLFIISFFLFHSPLGISKWTISIQQGKTIPISRSFNRITENKHLLRLLKGILIAFMPQRLRLNPIKTIWFD